jgi:hypothetical protein
MVSQSNHRPEPFDSPFALSLSKGERFAQGRLVEGCPYRHIVIRLRLRVRKRELPFVVVDARLKTLGIRVSCFELPYEFRCNPLTRRASAGAAGVKRNGLHSCNPNLKTR